MLCVRSRRLRDSCISSGSRSNTRLRIARRLTWGCPHRRSAASGVAASPFSPARRISRPRSSGCGRALTTDFGAARPGWWCRAGPRWWAIARKLLALARVEGGLARTRWDGRLMHWSDSDGFDPRGVRRARPARARRRRPGRLAPSGAYVEDWRFQPYGSGSLIGLSLLDSETRERRGPPSRWRPDRLSTAHGLRAGAPAPLPAGGRLEITCALTRATRRRSSGCSLSICRMQPAGRGRGHAHGSARRHYRGARATAAVTGRLSRPRCTRLFCNRSMARASYRTSLRWSGTAGTPVQSHHCDGCHHGGPLWLQEEGDTLLATVR